MKYVTMFDERPDADCEDLHARAAVDGYIPFAHVEQDKDHTFRQAQGQDQAPTGHRSRDIHRVSVEPQMIQLKQRADP